MRIYRETNRGKVAGCWTVSICDQHGKRRKFAGFPDKATTRELGRKLEKLVAARISGRSPDAEMNDWLENIPPTLSKRLVSCGWIDREHADALKPLMIAKLKKGAYMHKPAFRVADGHLADYERHLKARELCPRHIFQVVSHCARIFHKRNMHYPTDITTSAVESYVSNLRNTGKSARTGNTALSAIRSFCNWMVREGRMATNPVRRIANLNEKTDRRIVRRALTIDEARALIRYTPDNEYGHRWPAPERALVYRLALATGLRLNEIRTLEQEDFTLESKRPYVTIQAKNEKAKRGAVLPLMGDPRLAVDLAALFKADPVLLIGNANRQAFPLIPDRPADCLREDMDYARKRWRVDRYKALRRDGHGAKEARTELDIVDRSNFLRSRSEQGIVDFHALRHTFGTWLAKSGVHPKVCQEMMRHASIEITMQLYTHTLLEDKDEAARMLPNIIDHDDGKDSKMVVG